MVKWKFLLIALGQFSILAQAKWTFHCDEENAPVHCSTEGAVAIFAVNEGLTNVTIGTAEYDGDISKVKVTGDREYGLMFDDAGGGGSLKLIVSRSPKFDGLSHQTQLTLTDSNGENKNLVLSLYNLDNVAPIITSSQTVSCSVKENEPAGTVACEFTVHDDDGCASSITGSISSTSEEDLFSLEGSNNGAYPGCLQNLIMEKDATLQLKTLKPLDYEKTRNYLLTMTVKDGGGNAGNNLTFLLEVVDVADKEPVWGAFSPTITIGEMEEKDIPISATDGDTGIQEKICYSREVNDDVDPEEKSLFTMDEKTGMLHISPIDRDRWQHNSYELDITAYECLNISSKISSTLVVMVTDSINQMPSYSIDVEGVPGDQYPPQKIAENDAITFPYNVIVYDPDEGKSGSFSAEITGKYSERFLIGPTQAFKNGSFQIQVRSPGFDYEDVNQRNFEITLKITEQADPSHVINIPIAISVNDVNDNFPVFEKAEADTITVEVREDVSVGSVVATKGIMHATDKDEEDSIIYGIVSFSALEIDPSSGEIKLLKSKAFDYETNTEVQVQITASDGSHTTYVTLSFQIIDVNDEAPTITYTGDALLIPEDHDSTEVAQLVANDADATSSLSVRINYEKSSVQKDYVVIDTSKIASWFDVTIDNPDGVKSSATIRLLVVGELSWDVCDTIRLSIEVNDTNTDPSFPSYGYETIPITITDVNNKAPEFQPGSCDASRSINENIGKNINIPPRVYAKDEDGPGNNEVTYSMLESSELVTIDSQTGLISTIGDIDYEAEGGEKIVVTIVASDGVNSNTCQVVIDVADLNDNIPETTVDQLMQNVPENVENGTKLAEIRGTDGDKTEEFRTLEYSLAPESAKYSNFFAVLDHGDNTCDLIVSLNEDLDYDKGERTFAIVINVKDNTLFYGGQPSQSSKATINIALTDVNDNAPVFQNVIEGCFFNVVENTPKDIQVSNKGPILATDDDDGDNGLVVYEILDVQCDPDFSKTCPTDVKDIFRLEAGTSSQGENVRSNVALQDRYGQYLVQIMASDKGEPSLNSNATYRFCIDDINDHDPVFIYPDAPNINLQIIEKDGNIMLYNESNIPVVIANDDDFGDFGRITFSLEDTTYFSISTSNNRGTFTLSKEFADLATHVNLSINACDNDSDLPQRRCTNTKLTFSPVSSEPFEPEFQNVLVSARLKENTTGVFYKFQEADDKNNENVDDQDKQPIYYYLVDGDPTIFQVDSEKATLNVIGMLDRETTSKTSVAIRASNGEDPTKLPNPLPRSIVTIEIEVEDINDSWPTFEADSYSKSVTLEDDDKEILTIPASDPDLNDPISYSIVPVSIENNDGPIDLDKTFDITSSGGLKIKYPTAAQGTLKIQVIAKDSSTTEEHKSSTSVTVYLVPEKYILPFRFQNTVQEVQFYETEVINEFTAVFGHDCRSGRIKEDTSATNANVTILRTFFEDSGTPINPSELQSITVDPNKMGGLAGSLKQNYGLILLKAGEDSPVAAPDDAIKTALIAITCVLAVLFVALAVLFFIKNRRANNLIDRLTSASNEQQTEKRTMALPNTNKHIEAGSNPVWNVEIEHHDYDNNSIASSTDSGLIGIEDNPEFQAFYNEVVLANATKAGAKTSISADDDILRANPQFAAFSASGGDLGY